MAKVVSLHGTSGPISDIRIVDRKDINRNWTWIAVDRFGIQYREIEYRSIANLPKDVEIVRIVANVTGVDPNASPEFGVMVPKGANPIAFSRHANSTKEDVANDHLTVIGYEHDAGRMYVWITERGDALVTDRDIGDYD